MTCAPLALSFVRIPAWLDWNNRFTQGEANVERGAYMRIAIAER